MRFRLLATPCSHSWTVTAWKHSPTGEALDTYFPGESAKGTERVIDKSYSILYPIKVQPQAKKIF